MRTGIRKASRALNTGGRFLRYLIELTLCMFALGVIASLLLYYLNMPR